MPNTQQHSIPVNSSQPHPCLISDTPALSSSLSNYFIKMFIYLWRTEGDTMYGYLCAVSDIPACW